jgi:hypothetical protein
MSNPPVPATPPQDTAEFTYSVQITPRLVYTILGPYVGQRVREQLFAVLPISLFLFQVAVIRQSVLGGW